MASISKDESGNYRIQFMPPTGKRKRKTIRLGQVNRKTAETIKLRVESLVTSIALKTALDNETAAWVSSIGDDLAEKLAVVGLIPDRNCTEHAGLKAFCTGYVESRPDVVANTRRNLLQAVRYLAEFFGADRQLDTVTVGDAVRFASQMRADYAAATANRTIVHAKHFFRVAERDGLVDENPFRDVKGGTMSNAARAHFISAEDTRRLLDACPDDDWRLIVALARYGGLRTPSEHLALTWADMDWKRERFMVRSPKTGPRLVPMFEELRPFLELARDRAEPGALHVVTRTRDAGANWRTTFVKIIRRAGLSVWEKPFQNLRASRETELAQTHPTHVAAAWIGNSVTVASKHYLQVTEADFEKATRGGANSGARSTEAFAAPSVNRVDEGQKGGAKSGAREVQKAAQTAVDTVGHGWTSFDGMPCFVGDLSIPVTSCHVVSTCSVPREGVEPSSRAS